jgi:asparagine synthase (glutamine-hydrolysing)
VGNWLIARAIRAQTDCKVVFNGDGSDELFGGYNRYIYTNKYMEFLKKCPFIIRKSISRTLGALPSFGSRFYPGNLSYRLDKLISVLELTNLNEIYDQMIRRNSNPSFLISGSLTNNFRMLSGQSAHKDYVDRMMFSDILNYLPDDLLTKVDRAAMYNSLETRAPFLDINVIDFSNSLPLSMKIRNGKGKWIIRQVLKNYMPEDFFDKPKKGFAVPIGDWLKGPLKNLTLEMLSERRLINDGFLNYEMVKEILNEHFSNRKDRSHDIWSILIFQLWLDSERVNE